MLFDSLLNRENYHSWSRKVRRSIGPKNKLCFIENVSGIIMPRSGDKMYGYWKQANYIVITWLVKSMEPITIRPRVVWMNSLKKFGQIWGNDMIEVIYIGSLFVRDLLC